MLERYTLVHRLIGNLPKSAIRGALVILLRTPNISFLNNKLVTWNVTVSLGRWFRRMADDGTYVICTCTPFHFFCEFLLVIFVVVLWFIFLSFSNLSSGLHCIYTCDEVPNAFRLIWRSGIGFFCYCIPEVAASTCGTKTQRSKDRLTGFSTFSVIEDLYH